MIVSLSNYIHANHMIFMNIDFVIIQYSAMIVVAMVLPTQFKTNLIISLLDMVKGVMTMTMTLSIKLIALGNPDQTGVCFQIFSNHGEDVKIN